MTRSPLSTPSGSSSSATGCAWQASGSPSPHGAAGLDVVTVSGRHEIAHADRHSKRAAHDVAPLLLRKGECSSLPRGSRMGDEPCRSLDRRRRRHHGRTIRLGRGRRHTSAQGNGAGLCVGPAPQSEQEHGKCHHEPRGHYSPHGVCVHKHLTTVHATLGPWMHQARTPNERTCQGGDSRPVVGRRLRNQCCCPDSASP